MADVVGRPVAPGSLTLISSVPASPVVLALVSGAVPVVSLSGWSVRVGSVTWSWVVSVIVHVSAARRPAWVGPEVRVTLPSVAQAARIFPAVEWPMPAWAARLLVVSAGWACRAAHSLSSATVRPAGVGSGTACSARALRWAWTLAFVLGMATSFTVSGVGLGGHAPGVV